MAPKALKFVWLMVCLSCNMYQVGEISTEFFKYEVSTLITVKYPDNLLLPKLGICYNEIQLINWEELPKIKPNIIADLSVNSSINATSRIEDVIKVMKDSKTDEGRRYQGIIFKDMDIATRRSVLYNSSDLFNFCFLVVGDGGKFSMNNCSGHFNISYFQYSYFSCFSFHFVTQSLTIRRLINARADRTAGFMYVIVSHHKLFKEQLSDGILFFNDHDKHKRSGYFKSIPLSDIEYQTRLSYDEYTNSLLEYPYTTHCKVYEEKSLNIDSRGSCYESCFKSQTSKFLGSDVLFPGIFVFSEMIEKYPKMKSMTVHDLWENETLISIKENISKVCDNQCSSPQCKETIFIPQLLSSDPYPDPCIATFVMSSPEINTDCEPKLNVVAFLTNVFSTFGFWMGLSMVSCGESMAQFGIEIYKKLVAGLSGQREGNKETIEKADWRGRCPTRRGYNYDNQY